jgi:histidine triad (HIT) family protein
MRATCIFCKIAAGEIPAKILHADDHVVAFRDINPQAPEHVLVIPRHHVDTLAGVSDDAAGRELLGRVMDGARKVAEGLGIGPDDGYRLVLNCGERAGQSVFHLHVHVLGGRVFGWPPG